LGDKRRTWDLLKMINPINHGLTQEDIAVYKVEPYVVPADVYAISQHTGRGGWTWYTGSAGWMYQLIVESFIGIRREGLNLRFKPCLPPEWQTVKVNYLFQETMYHITFLQDHISKEEMIITVDNVVQKTNYVSLVNDRIDHIVEIMLAVSD